MARYRFLLGLAVLFVSLFVVSIETQAKTRSVNRDKLEVKDLSVNSASLLSTRKSRTSKEKSKALRRGASKACACSMVQDLEATGGSCFSNCMYAAGVTREKMAACFAFCVGAGTGNPLAIAACAGCLGIGEWIAGYCGLKCAWGSAFAPDDGPISKSRSQPRNKRVPNFVRV